MLSNDSQETFITPEWPTPNNVSAIITTRVGGVSSGEYQSFNLGDHVEDEVKAVQHNRQQLYERLGLSQQGQNIQWLQQVHGTMVAQLSKNSLSEKEADAVYSNESNHVCAVLTADCLPVLLCDKKGTEVAAVHCGWRSLLGGVLLKTLEKFNAESAELLAYLGPAISQAHFEVGEEVRESFMRAQRGGRFGGGAQGCVQRAFKVNSSAHNKYFADLYALAKAELEAAGVSQVFGGACCTYTEKERFYSYRRDGVTGRMASLIWLNA
ncbi:MAG: peptidoglycan editing factor PgeF [Agarilytica sp.]